MDIQLQGKLPKELLDSKDINLLRSIREWADSQVQSLKKEKEQKELDKYRPDIEGKFLKKINRSWRGPITVPNPKDFEIVYVKKIDFVGHGFIRCKTVVFNVVYSGFEKAMDKSNCTGTNFDGVEVSSWEDDQYDFSFEYLKDPVIMTKEMAQKEIDKAIACANSQKIAFWEYIRKN